MIRRSANSRTIGNSGRVETPARPTTVPRIVFRKRRVAAFSLVEVVLSLAVIATAFIGLLSLLPAGLDASREAANSTVVATVLEDLNNRLQNLPVVPKSADQDPADPDPDKSITHFTAWFDDRGVYIKVPSKAKGAALSDPLTKYRVLYRADVRVPEWKTGAAPANTSSLHPVTISLSWPVDENTGLAPQAGNPKTVVTYMVTTLTGTDWPLIDPTYNPKIEF